MDRTIEKNTIMIEPCAGLGNRLLAMTSAYELSRKSGKNLILLWKRERGCAIRSADLFEIAVPTVDISEMGWKNGVLENLRSNRLKRKYRQAADRFIECDEIADWKKEGGFAKVEQMVAREPISYIKSYTNLCEIRKESFSFLKPAQEVLARGANVFPQISPHTVGVHIRRTDHTVAAANSPLSLFIDKMKEEERKRETDFYVTTDEPKVIEELKRHFPADRLILYEDKVLDRDSKTGIQDALVDMLCLSKCRKILGSCQSTFSLIPSIMGGRELEMVTGAKKENENM